MAETLASECVGQDFLQLMHLSDALLESEKHLSKHNYLLGQPATTLISLNMLPRYPSYWLTERGKCLLLRGLIHAVLKLPFKDQDKRNKNSNFFPTDGHFPVCFFFVFCCWLAIITILAMVLGLGSSMHSTPAEHDFRGSFFSDSHHLS